MRQYWRCSWETCSPVAACVSSSPGGLHRRRERDGVSGEREREKANERKMMDPRECEEHRERERNRGARSSACPRREYRGRAIKVQNKQGEILDGTARGTRDVTRLHGRVHALNDSFENTRSRAVCVTSHSLCDSPKSSSHRRSTFSEHSIAYRIVAYANDEANERSSARQVDNPGELGCRYPPLYRSFGACSGAILICARRTKDIMVARVGKRKDSRVRRSTTLLSTLFTRSIPSSPWFAISRPVGAGARVFLISIAKSAASNPAGT